MGAVSMLVHVCHTESLLIVVAVVPEHARFDVQQYHVSPVPEVEVDAVVSVLTHDRQTVEEEAVES